MTQDPRSLLLLIADAIQREDVVILIAVGIFRFCLFPSASEDDIQGHDLSAVTTSPQLLKSLIGADKQSADALHHMT